MPAELDMRQAPWNYDWIRTWLGRYECRCRTWNDPGDTIFAAMRCSSRADDIAHDATMRRAEVTGVCRTSRCLHTMRCRRRFD
jgi:hypothetical protein